MRNIERRKMVLVAAVWLVIGVSAEVAFADRLRSRVGGGALDWDDPDTWLIVDAGGATTPAGRTPRGGDDVVIPDGSTVEVVGNKVVKTLTIDGGGRLQGPPFAGLPGGYGITTSGDVDVKRGAAGVGPGVLTDLAKLQAGGKITVDGVVQTGTTGADVELQAVGDVTITGNGRVIPPGAGGPPPPAGFGGKTTKIVSTAGQVILQKGGLGSAQVTGMPGEAGKPGGDVVIDAKVRFTKQPNALVTGGAGGPGGKQGNVNVTAAGRITLPGPKTDIQGGDVMLFGFGKNQPLGSPIGVEMSQLDSGDVSATAGSVVVATCSGAAIDLRGNSTPNIITAVQSVIFETETVFIDPGAPQLTSPPDQDRSPRATGLRDLNANGLADACEETSVNTLVSFAPVTSTLTTNLSSEGCPTGFVGRFQFAARLTNTTANPLVTGLRLDGITVTGGNLLLNAEGGPGSTNVSLLAPPTDGFVDGTLAPGDFVDVPFVICLATTAPFSVIISSLGTVPISPATGDLNDDGVVDCADIAIVRASFGLRSGQPSFDPRADTNGDGVVDIRDLAFVARQLPSGTRCP